MATLTSAQLTTIRQMLDRRDSQLCENLLRAAEDNHDYIALASEAPDSGDAAFADLTVELDLAAMQRELRDLHSIRQARCRLELSSAYGICVDCGDEIPVERLMVQPAARRCAPCQTVHEQTHGAE